MTEKTDSTVKTADIHTINGEKLDLPAENVRIVYADRQPPPGKMAVGVIMLIAMVCLGVYIGMTLRHRFPRRGD